MTAAPGPDGQGPLIILTYRYAGAAQLHKALSAHPALTCSSQTGILEACHQVATAWQNVDGRPGAPKSQLSLKSGRGVITPIVSVITARNGGRCWCEFTFASSSAAETLLQFLPGARFVLLHRSFAGVAAATLADWPWGLPVNGMYAQYVAAYPASMLAAVGAWWADRAGQYLDFEKAHPASCLRLMHDEVTADPGGACRRILEFGGLDTTGPWLPRLPDPPPGPDSVSLPAAGNGLPAADGRLPLQRIPALLLEHILTINDELGCAPPG